MLIDSRCRLPSIMTADAAAAAAAATVPHFHFRRRTTRISENTMQLPRTQTNDCTRFNTVNICAVIISRIERTQRDAYTDVKSGREVARRLSCTSANYNCYD